MKMNKRLKERHQLWQSQGAWELDCCEQQSNFYRWGNRAPRGGPITRRYLGFSQYSWPLNNMDFNSTAPLRLKFFFNKCLVVPPYPGVQNCIQRANYEDLEHLRTLVPSGILEPTPNKYQRMSGLSSASSHQCLPHQEEEWLMECSAQEAELNEGPGLLLDTQLRMGCRWDSPAEPPGSALFYIKKNKCQCVIHHFNFNPEHG